MPSQTYLIAFVFDAVVVAALAPLAIAAIGMVRAVLYRRATAYAGVAPVALGAALVTLGLLVGLARPLFQATTPDGYAAAIREADATGDSRTAAALATTAAQQYPDSPELTRLLPEMLLRAGRSNELQRYFQTRLMNGPGLDSRDELLILARVIRLSGWPETDMLRLLVKKIAARPDLVEMASLLEMQMDPQLRRDPAAAANLLRDAGATMTAATVGGRATIEGFSAHTNSRDRSEILVYFRPLVAWTGHAIWLHAYPQGTPSYIDLGPSLPAFDRWSQGELAWEVFRTADAGCYVLYAGVAAGGELGAAVPLGRIGDCGSPK